MDVTSLPFAERLRGTVDSHIHCGPHINRRTVTAFDAYTLWRAAGSNVGTTANTAQQISLLATANTPYLVLDTASGALTNWVNKTVSTARTAVDGNNVPLTDFGVLPRETAVYGPGFDQDTKYSRLAAYLTHAFKIGRAHV